jgi:hypothetical protein
MIAAQELQRASLQKSFREFCEKLKRNDEFGMGLRPARLWARGCAVARGQSIADVEGRVFDRNVSEDLLRYVETSKVDFPELAKEFDQVLVKAESTWQRCIAE